MTTEDEKYRELRQSVVESMNHCFLAHAFGEWQRLHDEAIELSRLSKLLILNEKQTEQEGDEK